MRMILGISLICLTACSSALTSAGTTTINADCLYYRGIYARDAQEAALIPADVAEQIKQHNAVYESRCK